MDGRLVPILSPDRQRVLGNIREAAERIWSRPLHRDYTDHTVGHSERVIALLDGLTAGAALSPDEVLILLAAAYLHDIGMQNERSVNDDPEARSGQLLEKIRAIHHEISADMIFRAVEDPAQAVRLGLPDDPGLVEAIALVAKGHRQVDLNTDEYDPFAHGNETIRLRLLAALLRFADELDIDHRRVDLEQIELMNLPLVSQLHWYKCHYVSGVSIVDGYIRVTYRFPKGRPDYEGLLIPLVERDIREKLAELAEIFWANGVKVALGRPQVRTMRAMQPLPAEVEQLARQMAAGKLTSAGSEVAQPQPAQASVPSASVPATTLAASVTQQQEERSMDPERKRELEGLIADSYAIIRDWERTLQISGRPEEKLDGRRRIKVQWDNIAGYLAEYRRGIVGDALPENIAQIAVHFGPVEVARSEPQGGGSTYNVDIAHGYGTAVGSNTQAVQQGGPLAGSSPPAPGVELADLRARLGRLDAVQIESLCLDHFPTVYDQFGRGLRRDEMINLLLDHCRRNPEDTVRLVTLLPALTVAASRITPPSLTQPAVPQVRSGVRGEVAIPPPPTEIMAYYALLIGVSEYVNAYSSLPHTVEDVIALETVLVSAGYTVRTLHSRQTEPDLMPTMANIWESLESIAGRTGPGDLLLVYFGGHGVFEGDRAYLIPVDGGKSSLQRTAIDLDEFKETIAGSCAQARVLILDACHSGIGRGDKGMEDEFERRVHREATGTATLAACRRGEVAYEHIGSAHGAFTYYLLEGLRGAAARAGTRLVTFNSLNEYVIDKVKKWGVMHNRHQWPNASSQLVGDPLLVDLAHVSG